MMNKAVAFKLAGAAALAGSSQAYGSIVVVTPPNNLNGFPDDGSQSQEIEGYDFYTGQTNPTTNPADFSFKYNNIPFIFDIFSNVYSGVQGFNTGGPTVNTVAATYTYGYNADQLTVGTKVGNDNPLLQFVASYDTIGGPGVLTLTGSTTPQAEVTYMGVEFTDPSGVLHNGYLELEVVNNTPSDPGGLFFLGAAYNSLSANAPDGAGDITVEALPEPGTISSLALGAAALGGVGLLRRRRSILAQD